VSDRTSYVDTARSACLCGSGSPGYAAAVCVADDGAEHLVLLREDLLGDPNFGYDPQPTAPHEQLGELPPRWRSRVQLAPLRCGRRTKTTGRPCRIEVGRWGDPCGLHRTKTMP
jgi:hypothetical protein